MALIRSISLTRSCVRISLRGICVLSVNEVAETWKVPGQFFGEGCLNGHPLRIATTTAMEECVIT